MKSANVLKNNRLIVAMVLILAAGFLLRGIFPLADPPKDLTISGGIVGDAGQHSYGARNRILFDQWSFDDWKPYLSSPLITPLINYPLYRFFGVNFTTHRLIPIIFSCLALLFFAWSGLKLTDRRIALWATIFAAFSYPLIIYSKTANRYLPMIFFFLVAFYFFVEGTEKKSRKAFFFSGLFMSLAYFSQNHVLYMAGFFFFLSLVWLLEKKVKPAQIALFWITLAGGLLTWYSVVFLPNRHFFNFFVNHNKLVRHIRSIPHLLNNALFNPYMVQFRNDVPVLVLAAMAIGLVVVFKFKKIRLPLAVEACAWWLVLGTGFHSIWSYRPTRFYLLMVFPAAILAAWLLLSLTDRKPDNPARKNIFPALVLLPFPLILFGGIPYLRLLKKSLAASTGYAAAFALFIISLAVLITVQKRKAPAKAAVAVLIILSVSVNLVYFFDWSDSREYKITGTADVLAKALPPAKICGNWASLLSIGTPHKTHLLSGEMGVNWRPDFFKEYHIDYLLLTRSRFADEYREYQRLFPQQLEKARLLARFSIYTAQVQLWQLDAPKQNKKIIEMESLLRPAGDIIFSARASEKMAVKIPRVSRHRPFILRIPLKADLIAPSSLILSGSGEFQGTITLRRDAQIIRRGLIKFRGRARASLPVIRSDTPLAADEIEITISRAEKSASLDCLEIAETPAD